MGDGAAVPVVAGLAVGIALVIMLSLVFMPVTALTDEKIIENTRNMKEVQVFLETHPDAEVRVERNDAPSGIDVRYSVERQSRAPIGFDSGIRTKELVVGIDSFGKPSSLTLVCNDGGRGTITFHVTMDEIATKCIVENINSKEVISLTKGCFGPCHTHSIFIFANGTTIHRDYEREGSKIYIFQIPLNETSELFERFYKADLSIPKTNIIPTDIILTQMSFTDISGKTTKIFYRAISSTPQIILDLDSQIEQLVEKYDDGIVDCTDISIRDCPVQEPKFDDESDEDAGLLIPEEESMDVGEPIEVFEANDDSTTIEIEYEE